VRFLFLPILVRHLRGRIEVIGVTASIAEGLPDRKRNEDKPERSAGSVASLSYKTCGTPVFSIILPKIA
jgi:hypothetical protein